MLTDGKVFEIFKFQFEKLFLKVLKIFMVTFKSAYLLNSKTMMYDKICQALYSLCGILSSLFDCNLISSSFKTVFKRQ